MCSQRQTKSVPTTRNVSEFRIARSKAIIVSPCPCPCHCLCPSSLQAKKSEQDYTHLKGPQKSENSKYNLFLPT
ncbi:hypothetical protein BDN70DRAFT_455257 [Pholiota conissans]|uniref:Uncharacterized protein n=1 Tax=Pholiota conissans TaxID=109636 RepID=A0A9P5YPZ8_9AGAR|nr:hypothetical protein BDN70DRAFT_455257 [Pholiota conissans]